MLLSLYRRFADGLARRVADGTVARLGPILERAAGPVPAAAAPAQTPPPGGMLVPVDYPTSARNAPRWGAEPHPGLARRLRGNPAGEAAVLERLRRVAPHARSVAEAPAEDGETPGWRNPMMPGLDACLLGAFLKDGPALYLEIGSGHSTRFARHFVRAMGTPTRIVSIDPRPRAECDRLCDELVRQPLETADIGVFSRLGPGDVIFFDGSHRCFMNSDVTVMVLDVLPRLPPGVIVGIHDVFLPWDYPAEWADRFYSEQYVIAAYLLGGEEHTRVVFPAYDVCRRRAGEVAAVGGETGCPPDLFHGCSLWLTRS